MPEVVFQNPSNTAGTTGTWTVPAGVTAIRVILEGAPGTAMAGAKADGVRAVTPGDVFNWSLGPPRRGAASLTLVGLGTRLADAGGGGDAGTITVVDANGVTIKRTGILAEYVIPGHAASGLPPTSGAGGDDFPTGGSSGQLSGAPLGTNGSNGQVGTVGTNGGAGGSGNSVANGGPDTAIRNKATGGHGGAGPGFGGGGGGARASYFFAQAASGGSGTIFMHASFTNVVKTYNAGGAYAKITIRWGELYNQSPYAPATAGPASQVSAADVEVVHPFAFADPDVGDIQSGYQFQLYEVGNPTPFVDLDSDTPPGSPPFDDIEGDDQQVVVPMSEYSGPGQYQWRVRTKDQGDLYGPWSAMVQYTIVAPSVAPSIVTPAPGSVVTTGTTPLSWTVTTQEAFQVRRTDYATPTVAKFTYPVVESSTQRDGFFINFPQNGVHEYVQIRVRVNGLWSTWAQTDITTAFVAPQTPLLTATALELPGIFRLDITHPTPGSAPDVAFTSVWARIADGGQPDHDIPVGGEGVRIAVSAGASYFYMLPRSGATYEFRVQAVAANETSAWSEWVPVTVYLRAMHIQDLAEPGDDLILNLGDEVPAGNSGAQRARYAEGRFRAEVMEGVDQTLDITTRLSPSETRSLIERVGRDVCVRTPRGEVKMFGMIPAWSVPQIRERLSATASFQVGQISYSEVV